MILFLKKNNNCVWLLFFFAKKRLQNIFFLRVLTKYLSSTKKNNYENNKNFKIQNGNDVTIFVNIRKIHQHHIKIFGSLLDFKKIIVNSCVALFFVY